MEATDELAAKIYGLVEAVKVDGKLRKGANEATKSIERGEAKLVIVAKDVNPPEVIMHLPLLCKEKDIPFVHVPAKNELGAAAGLPVGTAAVAIALAGDAKRKLDEVLDNIKALEKKPAGKPKEKPKEEKPKEEPKEEPKEVKEEKPEKEAKAEEIKEESKEKLVEKAPKEEVKKEKPKEEEK